MKTMVYSKTMNTDGVLHEAKKHNINSQLVLHAVAQAMLIMQVCASKHH